LARTRSRLLNFCASLRKPVLATLLKLVNGLSGSQSPRQTSRRAVQVALTYAARKFLRFQQFTGIDIGGLGHALPAKTQRDLSSDDAWLSPHQALEPEEWAECKPRSSPCRERFGRPFRQEMRLASATDSLLDRRNPHDNPSASSWSDASKWLLGVKPHTPVRPVVLDRIGFNHFAEQHTCHPVT